MSYFVWCKNEECRLPSFRCLLCREKCYQDHLDDQETDRAFQALVKMGKFKERFVMKKKDSAALKDHPLVQENRFNEEKSLDQPFEEDVLGEEQRIFIMEDGKLKPFSAGDYTVSTLYQVVESYQVESRLVRPEEPGSLVFEGKKPSRKTVPIVVTKNGDCLLLDSWESLEAHPEQLADAREVIGTAPMKQVFVLRKRK